MCRVKLLLMTLLISGLTLTIAGAADESLILYLPLDEGQGSTAMDASSYRNPGEIVGAATWVVGKIGMALEIVNNSHVVIPEIPEYDVTSEVTLMTWMKSAVTPTNWARLICKSQYQTSGFDLVLQQNSGIPRLEFFVSNTTSLVNATTRVDDDEWHFIAATLGNQTLRIYVDGIQEGENATAGGVDINPNDWPIMIGGETSAGGGNQYYGIVDEVAMFNRELTAEEIQNIFVNGMAQPGLASKPQPQDEAVDVSRDVILSWEPGKFANTHDVYFGTSFDDINDATAMNTLDLLVSKGQPGITYDPEGLLDFGQTYYWRVDEVNGAPDNTVFKGDVWSFIVEPLAIPIENVTATASGGNPGMGPENTVNGSGLNELDQHSTQSLDMWMAAGANPWIQYEFDKAYKLHELLVWNSNQSLEPYVGFGVKEVTINYSVDGENWSSVDGVVELAQATGLPTYQANTTIDLGGIMAKFVKLSVVSAYGNTGQSGLSEVRFMAIPVFAREPQPADGGTSDSVDVQLSWRAGREAALHQVYLGPDADNLVLIHTTDEAMALTDTLDYNTSYAWSVTEVNNVAVPASHAGDVWTFTTPEYAVIDNFESYSADEGTEVYVTWLDGFGGDVSLGGSAAGHLHGLSVETLIVNSGRQSMPIYIDNDGGFVDINGQTSSPMFSEVVREIDNQDWTASGIKTLSIMFAGSASLTGQLYCKINSVKVLYDGDASNLGTSVWQAWNIALSSVVDGNLTSVRELAIGVEGGTSGILYIDDIRLYPKIGEKILPVDPADAGLVAKYTFENNLQDSSGNSYNGTAAQNATYAVSPINLGSVLVLSGEPEDYIDLPIGSLIKTLTDTTFSMWVDFSGEGGVWQRIFDFGSGTSRYVFISPSDGNSTLRFEINGPGAGTNVITAPMTLPLGWHHVAGVIDSANMEIALYLDGVLVAQGPTDTLLVDIGETTQNWLGRSQFNADPNYNGSLDEFRIYDRVLTPGEILHLAGKTQPMHRPF